MQHMSHSRAIVVVAIGLVAAACGDADHPPPEDPAEASPQQGENGEPVLPEGELQPGSQLLFRIEGREGPMGAQAQVEVEEGTPGVHVLITGGDNGANMLMIDLLFDGLANTMGPHMVEFALPHAGAHVVNASFDGEWFYSQGGDIDVSLSPDGTIEGRFDVALAPDHLEDTGEPPVFEATDEATSVKGAFSGRWILNCHSRLAGHTTLIPGGDYCENLEF
jgi:hypothetical protein